MQWHFSVRAVFIVFHFILCIVKDSDFCGDEFIAVGKFVLLLEALPSLSQKEMPDKARLWDLAFFFFFFFKSAHAAYVRSQARGQVGAAAASLHHSHSNAGSKQHLRPTPHRTATRDP